MKNEITSQSHLVIIEEWYAVLQASGYRLTKPRQAVVEVLASSKQLLNPDDIYQRAKENYPRLGLVTVYRTLDRLEELDLVQKVHQPSGCSAYFPNPTGHQHLIICQDCDSAIYFHGDQLESLVNEIEDDSGFEVNAHWLQMFGVCSDCRSPY